MPQSAKTQAFSLQQAIPSRHELDNTKKKKNLKSTAFYPQQFEGRWGQNTHTIKFFSSKAVLKTRMQLLVLIAYTRPQPHHVLLASH